MTPQQFYHWLSKQSLPPTSVITLSPGPFALKIGPADHHAAKLLLWLANNLPSDATVEDLHDALDAAKFWSTFWTCQVRDDKTDKEGEGG